METTLASFLFPFFSLQKKIHYNQILCKHSEFCFTDLGESVFAYNIKAFNMYSARLNADFRDR